MSSCSLRKQPCYPNKVVRRVDTHGLLREPAIKARIASLVKIGLLDGKLLEDLSDVARTAWFSRYRFLQVSATHSDAALPVALVEEALLLRRRMLKTLDYNLDDDPDAVVRLSAIRAGSGHLDMANDLLANADFYRERKSDIEHDQKNYRKTDEADARRLADKILRLLGAVTTPEQTLWKNNQARAFTLLLMLRREQKADWERRRRALRSVSMCGRYTLTRTNLGEVVEELHAELDPSAARLPLPRYNIGPGQTCAIAIAGEAPLLTAALWGLRLGPRLVVNLRAETAGRRRDLQRCVIPADGFYEWTGEKGHKRPLWFHRPDDGLLFFAGLADEAGTFAIVTNPAAGPVLEVHDRAPVMFTAAKARTWLAEGGPPKGGAVELVGVEVSPRANSVKNDDAGLLEPVVSG